LTLLIGSGILQFLLSFFGSILLGLVFSLIGALIAKNVDMRKMVSIELSFFLLIAYVPYLLALKYLSGIMCLFTSGLVMSYYVTPNLSNESKTTIKEVTHTLAQVFEVFTFAFLGMAIFNFPTQEWDIGLIIVVTVSMLVGRFFNIFPLTWIVNTFLTEKIDFKTQLFLWW
jgi:NhaP-type Na+/H+ or K+/H+ antiporter